MKKIIVTLFAAFLASCSSVQEVQVPPGIRTRFPELAVEQTDGRLSKEEKKQTRRRPDGKLRVFLSTGAPVQSRSRAAQELALLRVVRAIQSPDIVYSTLNDPLRKPTDPMDARLLLTFAEGEEDDQFAIQCKTSEQSEGVVITFSAKPSAAEGLQIVRVTRPEILQGQPVLRVSTEGLKAQEVKDMLESSIRGTLEVQSTSAETEILLAEGSKPQSLGTVPVTGRKLDEGTYEIIARRKGQADRTVTVNIQAGQTKRLFITWPDDPESSATAILSSPPGLRIALNGQVRGTTPLYLVNENADSVEFSRPIQGNGFEALANTRPEGADRSRVLFLKYSQTLTGSYNEADLWQDVLEKASTAPMRGTRSRPFVVQEQTVALSMPVSEADGIIAWTSEQDSIFVERIGDSFVVQTGKGLVLSGQAKAFKPIKQNPQRTLEFTFDSEKKILEVELDGTTIWEGPFRPSDTGRLIILGKSALPAQKLEIRTGRGVYEK